MKFCYDDGGRYAAGFKGHADDCVTRAVAIAAELPYIEVYLSINILAKRERRSKKSSARNGVFKPTTKRYLESLGWKWTPTMGVGTGCTTHLRDGELPQGRLIVAVSRHYVAVINGVIHDTFRDVDRDGTRCVYGYWSKP